jgi:hypothetical protein
MSISDYFENQIAPNGTSDEVRNWRAKQDADFCDALLKAHGVENNPKASACYALAWSHGHSSGYGEVENYFNDFVGLIKEGVVDLPSVKIECSCKNVESMILDEETVQITGRPKTMSEKMCSKCGKTITVYLMIGVC